MYIVGVDYHPSFQQIAFLDQETGECGDRRLNHSDGEAEKFYRRQDLLGLLDRLTLTIDELTAAVEQEARRWPEAVRLMTHPGVGPLTALAFVLIIGTPGRFRRGKQIGSYIGLVPSEDSSGGRQRLGHISKQGNALLRFLLVEAAQAAARCNQQWRQRYWHLAMRREKSSPRWLWDARWPCGCTGCGARVGTTRS
jgi:transposase